VEKVITEKLIKKYINKNNFEVVKYNQKENWNDKIWFSADLHINHSNICYSTSRWENKETNTRRFDSISQMNDEIINNINKHVKVEDHFYLLGDLLFRWKTLEDYEKILNRINCQHIFLLGGNHDHYHILQQLMGNMNKIMGVDMYHEIEIDGKLVCMMHYPIHEWNNRHRSAYQLHGHSHGNWNKEQPKGRLDVGIDSAKMILKEYRPFSWKEIKTLLK